MDYEKKIYDETNKGRLFNNDDKWQISVQGKLNISGENHRIIGIKRLNKDNQPIVELYRAIGTLKEQPQKTLHTEPDFKGVINKIQNSGSATISAWRQVSDRGNHTVSLSIRDFDDKESKNSM